MNLFIILSIICFVFLKRTRGSKIRDNFLYLNGTDTQEVHEIEVPAYVNKCTYDILVVYNNINHGKSYGYITNKDKIIRDKSFEIACIEEERVFTNTQGYEIKTYGNQIIAKDNDDFTISLSFETTSSPVLEIVTTRSKTTENSLIQSNVYTFKTTKSNVETAQTTSLLLSKLISTQTQINTEINNSGLFFQFIKNSFNDTNDFVYLSIIVFLILVLIFLLYFFKDHIKIIWGNYLENREKRKIENTILKQKRIENIIRSYSAQPFKQEIIMLPTQPIVYPQSTNYLSENPPNYNFTNPNIESCDCDSKCFTQKCPCINNRRACNIHCHNGKRSSKCQNYN